MTSHAGLALSREHDLKHVKLSRNHDWGKNSLRTVLCCDKALKIFSSFGDMKERNGLAKKDRASLKEKNEGRREIEGQRLPQD